MNLTSPKDVRDWCRDNGFHPSRALGQNFLIDRNTLDAIVATSGAAAGMDILEIGPGLGVLTEALLQTGARVTAIEKDRRLAAFLRETLAPKFPNTLTLLEGDALKLLKTEECPTGNFQQGSKFINSQFHFPVEPSLLNIENFFVVSNLPYSVGTRILVELALRPLPPQTFTLLLQTEVAERMAAPENHPERALLSVWLQRLYDIRLTHKIPPTCFYPKPEVDSTLAHLAYHGRHPLTPPQTAVFTALTRHAFSHRRKQLLPLLRSLPAPHALPDAALEKIFASLSLDPKSRPEELSTAAWCELAQQW